MFPSLFTIMATLLTLNIRSLGRHYNDFCLYLNVNSFFPDIIVLAETWISAEQANQYNIPGYTIYVTDRKDKRAGGVVFYTKDTINGTFTNLSTTSCNAILFNTQVKNCPFQVIGVYRFPNLPVLNFLNDLNEFIPSNHISTVITGDINIDILTEQESSAYLDKIVLEGFLSIVNELTHFSDQRNACLDHLLFRSVGEWRGSLPYYEVKEVSFSDHCLIISHFSQINFKEINIMIMFSALKKRTQKNTGLS